MLTADQSIVEFRDGRAIPDRLTRAAHHHYLGYAERMLTAYRGGAGRQRRQLHAAVEQILANEPDCPVRRTAAFCKLLDDLSEYQADERGQSARLRLAVFAAAAPLHPLVRQPDRLFEHGEDAAKERIAAALNTTWPDIDADLYADVLAFQRLRSFAGCWGPADLLARYNVGQLQACLYRAERVVVEASGDFKTILRYAKLARLLHEIQPRRGAEKGVGSLFRPDQTPQSPSEESKNVPLSEPAGNQVEKDSRPLFQPDRYLITLSGPASILGPTRRYGVNLARFLAALLTCLDWKLTAEVRTPWNGRAVLALTDRDGFTSHLPPVAEFDSAVEQAFADKFSAKRDGWELVREGEVLHDRQTVFVPDFLFRHDDGTRVLLEIVGFWTPEYLAKKAQTLRHFRGQGAGETPILLAVPARSLRPGATPGDNVIVYKTKLTVKPMLAALERIRAAGPSGA